MKNFKFLFAIALSVLISGCEKTPKPSGSFSYSINGIFSPVDVGFSAKYDNAVSYHWDFGDNKIGTGSVVSHNYSTQGVYTVTLTVKGEGGETTETKNVNIPSKASKMKIYKVDVMRFAPTMDNGSSWDLGSGPDIRLAIKTEDQDDLWISSVYFEDATIGNIYSFDTDFTFTDFSRRLIIQLHDYETILGGNEFMGGVVGNVNNLRESYPEKFDFNAGDYEFKVHVVWE